MLRQTWLAMISVLMVMPVVRAEDPATWLQWRGPTRDGKIIGGPEWPTTLQGDALKPLWRVELAESYSSPIVAADRVFVTETVNKKEEVVRALDRKTGKELWQVRWDGSMTMPFFARENGDWIRSTPAYDGECLYVGGIRDVLVCLDGKDGKERWRLDFVKEFKSPLPAFGFVCSPLVDEKAVYVQAGSAFVKVDKKTGKVLWQSLKDAGGMFGSAFSSPTFAKLAGKEQLLVQTRTHLAGVDRDTGAVLWKQPIEAFRGMNILTPTVYKDGLFTSTYGGKTILHQVKNEDGKFTTTPAWTQNTQGYMTSPVIIDGHAYLHLKNRRFTCIDLETGKTAWVTDKPFGRYWSLIARGDRILALDERGILLLIKANPAKFELLDQRKISDAETWAHVTLCGDELYIRELNALQVYRWSQPPQAAAR